MEKNCRELSRHVRHGSAMGFPINNNSGHEHVVLSAPQGLGQLRGRVSGEGREAEPPNPVFEMFDPVYTRLEDLPGLSDWFN